METNAIKKNQKLRMLIGAMEPHFKYDKFIKKSKK